MLEGVSYKECHPFIHGVGSDRKELLDNSDLLNNLKLLETDSLKTAITDNPGRSDASAIWNSMPLHYHDKFSIATIGPGTRSHDDHGIVRKTHGPDEGFHKKSGYEAIECLIALITKSL